MDKELLKQAFAFARGYSPANKMLDDMLTYIQNHCEHRWAVWEESVYHLGLPGSGRLFCGRCGKEKDA